MRVYSMTMQGAKNCKILLLPQKCLIYLIRKKCATVYSRDKKVLLKIRIASMFQMSLNIYFCLVMQVL